jgi:hypothetical protein
VLGGPWWVALWVLVSTAGLTAGVSGCGGDEAGTDDAAGDERDTGGGRPRTDGGGGSTDPEDCETGERLCSEQANALLICLGNGEVSQVDCRSDETCVDGACVPAATEDADADTDPADDADADVEVDAPDTGGTCTEGARECANTIQARVCTGGVWTTTDCGANETCAAGVCAPAGCGDGKTYVGCEFLGADLDHWEPGDRQQYAISVSNPGIAPVGVSISDGAGTEVAGATVNAGGLVTFPLPRQDVDHSSLSNRSYRVLAQGPVAAHQFNPLNQSGVASNDASLLLPTPALGREYLVLGWPTVASGRVADGRAYATIIADRDNTTVTVQPTADIEAGGGVDAVAAGSTRSWTLNRGQVLSLGTNRTNGRDITGTRILATEPVAVFFGHECADIPLGTCCCDHIEQQLVSIDAWGRTVLAAKFEPRGSEADLWRIMASEDNTQVTLTPPPPDLFAGPSEFTLQSGEFREVRSTDAFLVEATAPVLVGQFMTGSSSPGTGRRGCSGFLGGNSGDPAYTLNVPTEQWLNSYVVLTPEGFGANHLTIVTSGPATIRLDGAPLSASGIPVGTTGYTLYRPLVNAGVHRVESDVPVGLYAYGYDCAVSYAYPGGMDLQ